MLVVKRYARQGVEIGPIPGVGMIQVYVTDIAGDAADIGIEAPRSINIRRCELNPLPPDAARPERSQR